jgi:hypothetical protein
MSVSIPETQVSILRLAMHSILFSNLLFSTHESFLQYLVEMILDRTPAPMLFW